MASAMAVALLLSTYLHVRLTVVALVSISHISHLTVTLALGL